MNCHGHTVAHDDNQAVDNRACVSCHEGYEAVARTGVLALHHGPPGIAFCHVVVHGDMRMLDKHGQTAPVRGHAQYGSNSSGVGRQFAGREGLQV